MNEYPEHEKLKLVSSSSHTIAFFLEWLGTQGIALCERYVNPESGRDGESLALMKKAGDDTAASGHGFLGDQSQIQPRGSQSSGRRRRRFQSGLSSRRIRIMGG